jgi:isopentenyldiphosphate isomerase
MSEEIFDVVDERDQVIGQMARSEVHRLGLMHRAVHILVFNRQGKIFLQKRSMLKDRQPGLWDSSSSGHVDAGEDYDESALRELREELGLRPEKRPERLFKLNASPETDQEHLWVYRAESEGPFVLQAEEISEGRWLSIEEVNRWTGDRPQDFATGFLALWGRVAKDLASR